MEKYLIPKTIGDFNKKEFWNTAFDNFKSSYDWYGNYNDFKDYMCMHIRKEDRILFVGCGNSTFAERFYDNGYHNLTCIDYSPTVIETMKKRSLKRKGLQYLVMDTTCMTFDNESFEVVVDKACLDAIYAEDNEKCETDSHLFLSEILRILRPDGFIFTITMAQNFICRILHEYVVDYLTNVFLVRQPRASTLAIPFFMFITQKTPSKKNVMLNFYPTDGFLRDVTWFSRKPVAETMTTEEFISVMEDTRLYFAGRSKIHDMTALSSMPTLSLVMSFNNEKSRLTVRSAVGRDEQNTYRFDVWDRPSTSPRTCALLVPTGSERSPSFTTADSIHQMMEEVGSHRMIVVTRVNSGHGSAVSDEVAKTDFEDVLKQFLPLYGSTDIIIYAPPPTEEVRNEIATGKTSFDDTYVVEDMIVDTERRGRRQMLFTSNMRAIQSEVSFHITGGKKKKKIFELDHLAFSIHNCMAASLLACPPLSPSPRILVLGLGGGCLPSFFQTQIPAVTVVGVDIDPCMENIARTYFRMPDTIQTVIVDGIQYVMDVAERGDHFDYVLVDIDSKDMDSAASFPPVGFLSKGFLENVKAILADGGVAVYNLCSRKPGLYSVFRKQFEKAFRHVRMAKSEDINQVLIASEREILSNEQFDDNRNDMTAKYLTGFKFNNYF